MTSKHVQSFPQWIRRAWPSGKTFEEVKTLLGDLDLHTVCQSAHCPNHAECWGRGTATFMVLGNVCTRHCKFCAVNSGKPAAPDAGEPAKVAEAARRLGLKHMVLTMVTRDDLPDGGADHVGQTIECIKALAEPPTVEVLGSDFGCNPSAIQRVQDAGPDVFSHNVETVKRLSRRVRDRRFSYEASLEALRLAKACTPDRYLKSAFMLGLGEEEGEVLETLADLREAGCDVVSIGQYLQPTPKHAPVEEYVTPETFDGYAAQAREMGFAFAVAGPFVRSSYRSEAVFEEKPATLATGKTREEKEAPDEH